MCYIHGCPNMHCRHSGLFGDNPLQHSNGGHISHPGCPGQSVLRPTPQHHCHEKAFHTEITYRPGEQERQRQSRCLLHTLQAS